MATHKNKALTPLSVVTRSEKVQAKEAAILMAAREVFELFGYGGARMSEVARRAGVAEGTVYTYFKNKDDVMRALLAQYWDGLSAGAKEATKADGDIRHLLTQLALFHMGELLAQYDFTELTMRMARRGAASEDLRHHMKAYVRSFDRLFLRAQDRGEFSRDAVLWQARDMFYGTLEYSARTLILHGQSDYRDVVDNLIKAFMSRYGDSVSSPRDVSTRLEAAVTRLEALVK